MRGTTPDDADTTEATNQGLPGSGPLAKVERLSVMFDGSVAIRGVDLVIDPRGCLCLVGPVASGKSTLLRCLAGLAGCHPTLDAYGLFEWNHPNRSIYLVRQNARISTTTVGECLLPHRVGSDPAAAKRIRSDLESILVEYESTHLINDWKRPTASLAIAVQRNVLLIRALLSRAPLVLLDEITAGLPDDDADHLLKVIKRMSNDRAVVFVTHNAQHAQWVADRTAVFSSRGIVEESAGSALWSAPRTQAGQTFVNTRQFAVMESDDDKADGGDQGLEKKAIPLLFEPKKPSSFRWLLEGRLGGLARPGIVDDTDRELAWLAQSGITLLIGLEERCLVAVDRLNYFDLTYWHFPIPDMGTPSLSGLSKLLLLLKGRIGQGDSIALHCRAGCGRTGLVLACWLIRDGWSAADALAHVRSINPRWVESAEQEKYLGEFAHHCRND